MFHTYFNRPKGSSVSFENSVSLTEQHHKDDLDINRIVNRALRDGAMDPSLNRHFGKFMDASDSVDFLEANIRYRQGVEAFENLSSKIRTRFNNDPHQLMQFLEDPANRDEAIKLGFIEKPVPVSPEVGTGSPLDLTVPTDTGDGTAKVSQ